MVAETSSQERIVIIDNNTERAKKIAASFNSAGCEVIRIFQEGGEVQYYPTLREAQSVPACLIALWHISDFRNRQGWPQIECACEVLYGGGGGSFADSLRDFQEVIQRPINEDSGDLRIDEARALINYVKERCVLGKEDVIRPAFLSRDDRTSLLAALCVLCQGYLAVQARRDESGWGPAEISSALDDMKWPSVAEDATKLLSDDLANKKELVESSIWWSRVLGEERTELQKQIAQGLGVTEGETPQAVSTLLDAICGIATTPISPRVVADAYCEISRSLQV